MKNELLRLAHRNPKIQGAVHRILSCDLPSSTWKITGKTAGVKAVLDWVSGTTRSPNNLGIPREDMPQIEGEDVRAFLDSLIHAGIRVQAGCRAVGSLRATQNELNAAKIKALMVKTPAELGEYPILISKDGYILDGHHRWAGLYAQDPALTIPVYFIHLDILELLRRAHAYAGVTYKDLQDKAAALTE
jgi:hypothetical protein